MHLWYRRKKVFLQKFFFFNEVEQTKPTGKCSKVKAKMIQQATVVLGCYCSAIQPHYMYKPHLYSLVASSPSELHWLSLSCHQNLSCNRFRSSASASYLLGLFWTVCTVFYNFWQIKKTLDPVPLFDWSVWS